jgi:two-component system, LytTR family, response regulator
LEQAKKIMEFGQKVYRCFIVDDSKLDRLTTLSFVRLYPFLNATGVFENAAEALAEAGKTNPDVLFLDVDMPGMNGLDLRASLTKVPACIFITAYPDYALPAFEVDALDFLIKPLSAERFNKTMIRLQQYLNILYRGEPIQHELRTDSLFIKEGREHLKISLGDILYLEALKDYTGVVTPQKKYCILSPLGNLLSEKSFEDFIRIHRSYAVPRSKIQRFNSRELTIADTILPVGRIYKDLLHSFLTPDR